MSRVIREVAEQLEQAWLSRGYEQGNPWAYLADAALEDSSHAQLVETLAKYGKHLSSCNATRALPFELRSGSVKCTCGFKGAVDELADSQ